MKKHDYAADLFAVLLRSMRRQYNEEPLDLFVFFSSVFLFILPFVVLFTECSRIREREIPYGVVQFLHILWKRKKEVLHQRKMCIDGYAQVECVMNTNVPV